LSFPISHSPVQVVPVLDEVTRDRERIYVSCGERELRFGMNWTVEYSLGESDAFLTQRTVFLILTVTLIPGRHGQMQAYLPVLTQSSIFPMDQFLFMIVTCGPLTGTPKVLGASQTCIG